MSGSWVGKIPWRTAWQPTSAFLPGESHGQRSLADFSPQGCQESDTTKVTQRAHTRWTIRRGLVVTLYLAFRAFQARPVHLHFSFSPVVKNSPGNAGNVEDVSLIHGSGRSPGAENGNPLQYSCLENSKDREAWWATVHGVPKSWTRLSTHTPSYFVNETGRYSFSAKGHSKKSLLCKVTVICEIREPLS